MLDGRLFGDRAGIAYSVDVAYETGRLAISGGNRKFSAWATTAHVDWQTSFVWRPKLVLSTSYASGDSGNLTGKLHRFDPLFRTCARGSDRWGSTLGRTCSTQPWRSSPRPPKISRSSSTTGTSVWPTRGGVVRGISRAGRAEPNNDSTLLGNEIDAEVTYAPLDSLAMTAGYGAFFTGQGARTILSRNGDVGPRCCQRRSCSFDSRALDSSSAGGATALVALHISVLLAAGVARAGLTSRCTA